MAKSTKSYEERMLEMEKREQESLEKAKRYAAQKKELLKRKKTEESKKLSWCNPLYQKTPDCRPQTENSYCRTFTGIS